MGGLLCRGVDPGFTVKIDRSQLERRRMVKGAVFAAGVAATAWRMRALSLSGFVAATLIGTLVYAGMGVRGSVTMVIYFASSSALGRLPGQQHRGQQRGNRRDAVQVLVNGGPAVLFSLLGARFPGAMPDFATSGFYGSLAAAAADTWATEIGTRWGGSPRSIATGRRMAAGASGGVTLAGLAASVGSSLAIAAAYRLEDPARKGLPVSCAVGGLVGSVIDSLLGALIQEQRWCESCGSPTELLVHTCGRQTRHLSGVSAVNNDVVNLLAVITGGLAAGALSMVERKLTERNGSRVELLQTSISSRSRAHVGLP